MKRRRVLEECHLQLPLDILEIVVKFLPLVSDYVHMLKTCRHWYRLSQGDRHERLLAHFVKCVQYGCHTKYTLQGKEHSVYDRPASICRMDENEYIYYWYRHGQLHRDNDSPSIISEKGDKHWYANGVRHRGNDRPAIELANGIKFWIVHGVQHRDGDLPAYTREDGTQEWWKYGKRIK